MKLILAFLFMGVALSALAQNQSYDSFGAIKTQHKEYLPVVNSASGPFTVGMAVCVDVTSDDGIAVDFCSAEGAKPLGIVASDCIVGARCLLQTKGYFAAGKFDFLATATVAGGMIYADIDGDLTRPATVTTAMSPIGIALDAVAADSSALELYIDL